MSTTRSYDTVFFYTRPQAFARKSNVLHMERGGPMLTKLQIYIGSGCRVGL